MSTFAHIALPPCEKFQEVVLDQQGTTQYPHNLEDWPPQFEFVFVDGNKAIGDNGDVYLYSHSVLAVAPDTFDAEMLLEPFEEKLDLPSVTVKQGDVLRRKVKVVGVVHKGASEVCSVVDNPSQFRRVVASVTLSCESDGLVKENSVLPVKHIFSVDNLNFRFPFLPDNEERTAEMFREKPCEVEIPTVEDVAGVGLVANPVHSLVVADFGVGDSVEYRDFGDDVNLRMYLDSRLSTAEECPAKDGHTEVDGSGIDGVETPVEFKLFCDSPLLGKRDHIERKLLEDSRLAEHIGFGKSAPNNSRVAKSKLVAPFCMCRGNICELSKCAASKKLPEDEYKKVIPMRKAPVPSFVIEFGDNSAELPLWQIHCDLGEYVSSVVHLCSILYETKVRISSPGQHFPFITQCS